MKRLSIFFLFLLALTELLSEVPYFEGVKSRAEAGNDAVGWGHPSFRKILQQGISWVAQPNNG